MKSGSCLIVTLDGLRRDRATADLMPELAAFMAAGTDFVNSRSVFPSETRVAVTSTMTGTPPREHGVVANQFIHPSATPGRMFQTGQHEDLQAADAIGALVDRMSLGERLAAEGRIMAVVSTASTGATWMMNHRARDLGHPVYSMHGVPVTTPDMARAVAARIGAVPPADTPNVARVDHAVQVVTQVIYPDHDPHLCVLWLSDPDITSHTFGVTAVETAAAQAACDAAFGRLVAWWRRGDGPENLIVLSDHGQITGRQQINIAQHVPEFRGQVAPGAFTGLYLDAPTPREIEVLVAELARQPWCGLILSRAGPDGPLEGSFDLAVLGSGHPRSPVLGFTLRATPPFDTGAAEREETYFAAGIPVGGGIHGGLTRGELSTALAAAGPAFGAGQVCDTPCWLPDIAPTVLQVLGMDPTGTTGRVLAEGLSAPGAAPEVTPRRLTAKIGDHEQVLDQWVIDGGTAITDCGWVVSEETFPS